MRRCQTLTVLRSAETCGRLPPCAVSSKGADLREPAPLPKALRAQVLTLSSHARFSNATHFGAIETNTMQGFNNPRFNMGRQSQATNSVHGLLKSVHTLLLNWVSPARPLSVHA
eukprot:695906-Amphidinium_carterae.1